ncbi:MAG: hypothetical protein ACOZDY_06855 [Pseudomonadota bacterium]
MASKDQDQALLELVGRCVRFQGVVYAVVEVLEQPRALVLERALPEGDSDIQTDSMGYAHRCTPHQEVVSVLDEHGGIDLPRAGIEPL